MTYGQRERQAPDDTLLIQEDPAKMSARLGGKILAIKGAGPGDTQPGDGLDVVVRNLIGNTDWSIPAAQRQLFARNGGNDPFPIARDFCRTGEREPRQWTRASDHRAQSPYRGYCANESGSQGVRRIDSKKEAIYGFHHDKIRLLLPADRY